MTTPSPYKLTNIQSLRGLAALLVVLAHLPPMEIKHGGHTILPSFFRLGISGVDLFFVISGFIMIYVTWRSERSVLQSLKFLFARFTRIYPIYWLIAGAVFLAWTVKPSLMTFDTGQTSLVKSFLLWPDKTAPMITVAWTLIHEIYFYIVFAVILLLPKRFLMPALGLWGLAVLGGVVAGLGSDGPEMALIFHPLTFEFLLGAFSGWLFMRSGENPSGPRRGIKHAILWLSLGTAGFIGGIGYFAVTLNAGGLPTSWARVIYWGVPAAFIVYGLAAMDRNKAAFPKWSSTFGDWSYSLYLSHILTLSILGYIWRPFARSGPIDNIIALSILLAGCIVASALSWYVFEKPMLVMFKRLRVKFFH